MNRRVIGMAASVFIIVTMVVLTIKTNFATSDHSNEFSEYTSGNIEDLPSDLTDESIDTKSGLQLDERAPDFQLTTLTGESVRLSDYRGKKVVLNFWASWCPPCRVEMPYMENYYKKNKDSENVEILAVNMTKIERGNREKVNEFIDDNQLTFPILFDEDGEVMKLYQVRAYPTTYIISTDGIITDKIVSALDEEAIKKYVSNSR